MSQAFLSAALIFLLRIVDISFYSLRLLMLFRGRKAPAWLFGFLQSSLYLFALKTFLTDLTSWPKVIGYAAGFATGMVFGMYLEDRLAIGYLHLRIVSPYNGMLTAERLRQKGFAVTEVSARGKNGMLSILHCSILRKHAAEVEQIIYELDPDVFITAENIRLVHRGFWHR